MNELDKSTFGQFVAERRKVLGLTQKNLADRLYVSDKAVSKWERGLSMPDISLLKPLSQVLEVSIPELLEGHHIETLPEPEKQNMNHVIEKAFSFSEQTAKQRRIRKTISALQFLGWSALSLIEIAVGYYLTSHYTKHTFFPYYWIFIVLSFSFGLYFWLFMREYLPGYYDENKINIYTDGFFSLQTPGVYYNNRNWPHILHALRKWSILSLLGVPVIAFIDSIFVENIRISLGIIMIALVLYLGGLFLPIYYLAKKYE